MARSVSQFCAADSRPKATQAPIISRKQGKQVRQQNFWDVSGGFPIAQQHRIRVAMVSMTPLIIISMVN
jgi:hypothetical protein